MSTRKEIRDALMGAKSEFKKEVVKFNGVEVEIRQPTVKSRKEIMERATKNGEISTFEFLVWAVIESTFVKGTDEKVFEYEDYDSLVSKPVGGFMDKFGEIASNLMNVEEDVGKKAKK
jgi:hypothetical protein